jgi:hypothetical protein
VTLVTVDVILFVESKHFKIGHDHIPSNPYLLTMHDYRTISFHSIQEASDSNQGPVFVVFLGLFRKVWE